MTVPRKRAAPTKTELLIAYGESGRSASRLSKHYGVPVATIAKWLKTKAGIDYQSTAPAGGRPLPPWLQKANCKSHSRGARGGKREDLGGIYLRSSYEANYARYLNWLVKQGQIHSWEYEPKVFSFLEHGIKRGKMFYCPDFLIHYPDGSTEWHEVKGWMDNASKTKLRRFAKFYPDETLVIIGSSTLMWIGRLLGKQIGNLEPMAGLSKSGRVTKRVLHLSEKMREKIDLPGWRDKTVTPPWD